MTRRPRVATVLGKLVAVTLAATPACHRTHDNAHGDCSGGTRESIALPAAPEPWLQRRIDRCRASKADCPELCEELHYRNTGERYRSSDCALVTDAGGLRATYTWGIVCAGRRPPGWRHDLAAHATVGMVLAHQAALEAASVDAFHELADALAVHGAPRRLIRAARRAAADEVVHARSCAKLAHRFGATVDVPPPRVRPTTPSLFELACENAVEGEVRETWGATIATWQARTAEDPAVAGSMRAIARDETRHAELARAIGAWIMPLLPVAQRGAIDERRQAAIAELRHGATKRPHPRLRRTLGLPGRMAAARLLRGVERALWR